MPHGRVSCEGPAAVPAAATDRSAAAYKRRRGGGLWAGGKLVGKVGSVATSTASQHGGQESTLLSTHTVLLHHGMVAVGLAYAWQGQTTLAEISGGNMGTLAIRVLLGGPNRCLLSCVSRQ